MALPTSGPLSIAQIEGEFGGSGAKSLSEYYSAASGVPSSGNPLSISDFRGTSNVITFSYEIIGGGGGGGYGLEDHGGSGRAGNGDTSYIQVNDNNATGSAGINPYGSRGRGGRNGVVAFNDGTTRDGDDSVYGAGGQGGNNGFDGNSPAATSYGAGGGGGGGDQRDFFDKAAGNAGEGGEAGGQNTGTITAVSGVTVTMTIGAGGAGSTGGNYSGGDGASGFVRITYNGQNYDFASSGTVTLN